VSQALNHWPLFDSHLHIIDGRFPLQENNGYLPPLFDVDAYRAATKDYQLRGGAIVSGSFQGFDQSYLIDALQQLGEGFVGVTQLPATVSDEEILRLDRSGVRALRFNLRRGGSERIDALESMARRVHALAGWHIELYVDAASLGGLADRLPELPAVSIDHLGLSLAGLPTLQRLAEQGVRVKATGFGRLDFEPAIALRALYEANPEALMFGTDLPSTRAPRPYAPSDFLTVVNTLGEEGARRVLCDNALNFYRKASR